jgi:hypothetical protein
LPGPLVLSLGLVLARPDRLQAIGAQVFVFVALAILAVPFNLRAMRRYDKRIMRLDQI